MKWITKIKRGTPGNKVVSLGMRSEHKNMRLKKTTIVPKDNLVNMRYFSAISFNALNFILIPK